MSYVLKEDHYGTRRTLWMGLKSLTDEQRLRFVRWACKRFCPSAVSMHPVSTHPGAYEVWEAFNDISLISFQFRADFDVLMIQLDRWCQKCRQGT